MPEENIDILINAGWLIPVVPRNTVLRDCSIAIRDGRIIALLPSGEAQQRFSAEQQFDLPDALVIPGLINAHAHAAMADVYLLHDRGHGLLDRESYASHAHARRT